MAASRSAPGATFETMVRVLAPYLGATMARAAVHSHGEKLGLHAGAELRGEDRERMLEHLGPGLVVFVGREKTERILAEIRAALPRDVEGGP